MSAAAALIANDSPFCESRRLMKKLEDDLVSAESLRCDLSTLERDLTVKGQEMMRALLQANLDLRAQLEHELAVDGIDGKRRERARQTLRRVETLFGQVTVERLQYQSPGSEGLAPMDAALNLPPERYSHEVRRLVAEESARSSFDEVVELVTKRTGAAVPKRQVEELAARAAQDFDAFYAERGRAAEATTDLLVMSFDGKGVAMRHDDLREATRKAAASTPRRLDTRLVRGEKPNRKRMATVAAIYTLAPWQRTVADVLHTLRAADVEKARPRPVDKRVWASLADEPQKVHDDAFAEANRRDPHRTRRWVVLVDGQRDQIRRIKIAAKKAKVAVTIKLDIVHVLEYLWRAAYAFHAAGSEDAETWVRDRLLALLTGTTGGGVAKSIRLMASRRSLEPAAARAVETCARYLSANSRLLHYDVALRDGLPIATGVIEGACRHLIQDRLGRTGARWSLVGAEAVLRLRALRSSGDLDAYWDFHLAKEHERNHRSRYADASPPDPLPKRRPSLRLVK